MKKIVLLLSALFVFSFSFANDASKEIKEAKKELKKESKEAKKELKEEAKEVKKELTGEADLENGKKVWKKINCASCHGNKAEGKAKTVDQINAAKGPHLAGLKEAYIVAQMKAVQSGEARGDRPSKNTVSMKQKIKKLTDKDFADVAAYIHREIAAGAKEIKGLNE